jgi:N-acetyl sugar amidotransferase
LKYCHLCLQPDTRPNTRFSDDGICPACTYFDQSKTVDWESRRETLFEVVKKYRNPSAQYDCIIGVSGGKDSMRQAIWVRDYLKLRPLLVSLSYPPEQVTEIGVKNLSTLIEEGFDCIQSCPAPGVWRDLMRESFLARANFAVSTEMALFSAVPQLAAAYKIPLILWGENPGLQLGDLKTLGSTGYDGNQLRHMNTLSGATNDWMRDIVSDPKDLIPYSYPSEQEFLDHNIQIVYLGWFLGDWSLANNGAISALNGLEIRRDGPENTGDLLGVTALDDDWVTLNQMIKFYKYGFGRATDYVNEMIRFEQISRAEAIAVVEKYDGACSEEYISDFCDYLGISSIVFWETVHGVTDKKLFHIDPAGKITPKFTVGSGLGIGE